MGRKRDQPGELPQGVLTFLLTDIEGSTPLWERHGADMGAALARPRGAHRPHRRRPRRPAHQGPGRGRLDPVGVRAGQRRGGGRRGPAADPRPHPVAGGPHPPDAGGAAHRGGRAARPRLLRAGPQPGGPAARARPGGPDPAVEGDGGAGGRPAPARRPTGRRGRAPAQGAVPARACLRRRPPRPGRSPAGADPAGRAPRCGRLRRPRGGAGGAGGGARQRPRRPGAAGAHRRRGRHRQDPARRAALRGRPVPGGPGRLGPLPRGGRRPRLLALAPGAALLCRRPPADRGRRRARPGGGGARPAPARAGRAGRGPPAGGRAGPGDGPVPPVRRHDRLRPLGGLGARAGGGPRRPPLGRPGEPAAARVHGPGAGRLAPAGGRHLPRRGGRPPPPAQRRPGRAVPPAGDLVPGPVGPGPGRGGPLHRRRDRDRPGGRAGDRRPRPDRRQPLLRQRAGAPAGRRGPPGSRRAARRRHPRGVRHVIGRRLNQLSEEANASLAAASVQGREFDLDVVARAAGLPADAVLDSLEEALEARLVTEVGRRPGRFRFAHALVRETLYDELPVRERRRLHDRVGAALVELRGDDFEGYLAELAHHFSQAARPGQADQAVSYARQAGDRAMKVLAYEEAADHYQRALRALDLQASGHQAVRCELLLDLAPALMAAGETAEARDRYQQAAELAKRMGDGSQLARAAFGLGVEFTAGSVDELEVGLLEEALTVLGETDSALRARVLGRLAKALQSSPRPDRRAQLSQAAVEMARRIGDPATLAEVLYERHMATWGPGNLEERLAMAAEVVRLAETGGDRVMALRGREFLMANQLELGDLPALEQELEAYDRAAQELRQLHFSWHVPLFRAGQALLGGRLEEADRLAADALALGRRARDPVAAIYHTIVLVGIRWEQGRLPELEDTLARFVDRFPANLGWRATLAVLLCETGRHDQARTQLDLLAADDFSGLPGNHLYLYHLAVLAIVCHALDDQPRAARLYELLVPYAERNVLVARVPLGTLGSASHHLGLLAATLARRDAAASHLQAAVRAHDRMGAPLLLARSRRELAGLR